MSREPCDRCEELLQDYLDRTLTDVEWREAETHLADCDYCSRRYKLRGEPSPVRPDDARSSACRRG